jgi:hypothetical protein
MHAATAARIRIFRFKRKTPSQEASSSLFHSAGTDTGSADANVLVRAIDHGSYPPQIRIPAAPRHIVGVADRITKARLLAAKFTYHCHCCFAPDGKVSNALKTYATRDSSKREAICRAKHSTKVAPIKRALNGQNPPVPAKNRLEN